MITDIPRCAIREGNIPEKFESANNKPKTPILGLNIANPKKTAVIRHLL